MSVKVGLFSESSALPVPISEHSNKNEKFFFVVLVLFCFVFPQVYKLIIQKFQGFLPAQERWFGLALLQAAQGSDCPTRFWTPALWGWAVQSWPRTSSGQDRDRLRVEG